MIINDNEDLSYEKGKSSDVEADVDDKQYSLEYPNPNINDDYFDDNNSCNEEEENENKENNKNNNLEYDDSYIAKIEGLEDELYIEQYITKKLQKDSSYNEELLKLENELSEKNKKLEQLKTLNQKQQNTINDFKDKLNKESNKQNMNNKVILINTNKKEVSKNEFMNNVIKTKDKELLAVIDKMNTLKKENEELKKKISQNENANINFNYIDSSSKKNFDKINFLQKEIKNLNKQLLEHNKCIEEQNNFNKNYTNLKNELKLIKNSTQEMKNKINDFEKKILNLEISDINNSNNNKDFIINTMPNVVKNSNINIQKRQNLNHNVIYCKTLTKTQNDTLLPTISIQPLSPKNNNNNTYNKDSFNYNKSILTNDFVKKMQKFYGRNQNDYIILINKLQNLEKNVKSMAGKKYNSRTLNLKNANYMGKFNDLKEENREDNKKALELKEKLENLKNAGKEKDGEISKLLNQINELKKNN